MDKSLKDRVLESIDIVELVGERVSLTRKGKDFIGLCPFHADHKPSLAVSPTKQIFKCWSCGAGGDAIRFIQLWDRVEFREALETLARRAGIEVSNSPADRLVNQARTELQSVVTWAREHFQHNLHRTPAGERALDYARRRGLTDETIGRHGLGLAPDSWNDLLNDANRTRLKPQILAQAGLIVLNEQKSYDRFRNRLIFPINDAAGRPIAFGGRTLADDPAKYLNSPETVLFSKSRVLYAFDLARRAIEQQKAAIVVEGYMDAVLLHQFGFTNVVATLGTALTDAHAKLLRPRADTLYLCFDGDAAGVKAADRAVEVALRTQTDVRVVLLPGDQDPADCVLAGGAEAFSAHLNSALDALEFKWSQTLKAFGAGGAVSRRQALEQFLQFVAGATAAGGFDALQQTLLVNRLSELLGTPPAVIFDLLASARRNVARGAPAAGLAAEGASDYDSTIRGLPAGLITTAETVFGLLLIDPTGWVHVDDSLARTAELSQTWRRLYGVFLDVQSELGEYSIEQILQGCDDSATCELVDRARARVRGVAAAGDELAAAIQRLNGEIALLAAADTLSALPHGEDTAAKDAAFEALRRSVRGRESPVQAESQWNLTSPPTPAAG